MSLPRPVTKVNIQIPAGQFHVFYFSMRDQVRCDRDGNPLDGHSEAGFLFDSLEDAGTFAKAEANRSPKVGSGVYNSSWQVVEEFLNDDYVSQQAWADAPGRLLLWAGAMLIAGSTFLWLEIHSGWTFMFGFLIGSRLLFSGAFKLARGVWKLKRSRQNG